MYLAKEFNVHCVAKTPEGKGHIALLSELILAIGLTAKGTHPRAERHSFIATNKNREKIRENSAKCH